MFRDAICSHEKRVFLDEELIGLYMFYEHDLCSLVQCVLFYLVLFSSLWSMGSKSDTPQGSNSSYFTY